MKKFYLFLNEHMKTLAVLWAACLLVVAVALCLAGPWSL